MIFAFRLRLESNNRSFLETYSQPVYVLFLCCFTVSLPVLWSLSPLADKLHITLHGAKRKSCALSHANIVVLFVSFEGSCM